MLSDPRIFTYGTVSDHISPLCYSSKESVTPTGNTMPRNNPPNPVPNVPAEPYLDTILSDSSLSNLSYLSSDEYYKRRWHAKKKKKRRSKTHFHYPIKSARPLQITELQLRTNQRSYSSNSTRIHYITGFISYLSLIYLKLFHRNLRKLTCCLWNIHT